MVDVNELLREYHAIVQQLNRLGERRNELREMIGSEVAKQGNSVKITIGETEVQATVRSTINVEYNEEGLRKRLGERIRDILAPDATKVRKHLTEIAAALEPFLDTVGSVSRERVAECIQAGKLSVEDFAGLYKKEQKNNLVVRMVPTQRTDADYLK